MPVAVPKVSRAHVTAHQNSSASFVGSPTQGTPSGATPQMGKMTSAGNICSASSGGSLASRPSSLSPHSSMTAEVTDSFVKIEGFHFNTAGSGNGQSKDVDHTSTSLLTKELSSRDSSYSSSPSSLTERGVVPMYKNSTTTLSGMKKSTGLHVFEQSPGRRTHTTASPSVPESVLLELQKRYPVFREPLVARAFNVSRLAHDGQINIGARSGPTFEKCVSAAIILADLGADETAISCALVHDLLDGHMLTESQLGPMLGSDPTVKELKTVSHMSFLCQRFQELSPVAMRVCAPQETSTECLDLISMMLAHASPKALLVRLSVALAEMKICATAVRRDSSMVHDAYVQQVAHQAMNIWAPLANRIGVWSIKSQLEDLSFSCLLPNEYAVLAQCLSKAQEPTALISLMDGLREALQEHQTEYIDLSGRPKHLWGVWCKMQKKGYSADRVQDVRGLRVIVSSREDCYKALRAVESSWKVVGQSKNYIKDPKKNGYQSLHVIADPGDGHLVEIQIRTDKMHYLAEYGADASHWKYKEVSSLEGDDKVEHASREANWAKFVTQKHTSSDKKIRPSGSPTEDKSLEQIMSVWKEMKDTAKEEAGKKLSRRSFHEYIKESGQVVAPPNPENARVIVALVSAGAFSVETVTQGTTAGDLVKSLAKPNCTTKIIINRQVVDDSETMLKNGDAVEVHHVQEPVRSSRSNLMPLGKLSAKLKRSSLST